MNNVNISNKVCVLIDPETRHIDYIPIDQIKVSDDLTIKDLFTKFDDLSKNVQVFEKSISDKIEKLISIINLQKTQIELLTKNQTNLANCYNNLQTAFKKQTAHSSANLTNLMYAIKLLGGKL